MVPMAVPLLLFDSDLRRVWRDTGTLLIAFLVGAFSTIVGTFVAYPFLRNAVDWKVASALTARHIGGAINFVAVADTYQLSGTMVSAAIAADNIVVALYFAFLFSLSKPGESKTASVSSDTLEQLSSDTSSDSDISLGSLGTRTVSEAPQVPNQSPTRRSRAGFLPPGLHLIRRCFHQT